jgi:hypothetical protein
VLFIMGAARSGSTILGVTVGNCANVFYAGELRGWLETDGVPGVGGEKRLAFWEDIRERVTPPPELGGDAAQSIERTVSVLRPRLWLQRRRLRPRYRQVTGDLFHTIARAAEVTHVVDSSSYPLRALELKRIEGLEVHLVYLVRDPHAVVASFTGPEWRFSGSIRATNGYLWLTTLLSTLVFLGHRRDRRVFVRHEDFIAEPANVIARILECAELDVALPALDALDTGIHYGGNRNMRSGEITALRSEPEPPARRLLMTSLAQGVWAPVLALLAAGSRAARAPRRLSPRRS